MFLTPLTSLTWAYQLHYYTSFRTHRRRKVFQSNDESLYDLLRGISNSHDIHLLELQSQPDHVRSLMSLRPNQPVGKVMQTLKTNSSREWNLRFHTNPPLWARGYFAASVGQVRIDAVSKYLDDQPAHHGYDKRFHPPIYQYRNKSPVVLTSNHCVFDLTHHLVLSTRYRKGLFGSDVGKALTEYWLKVAAKHRFAIDQLSLVPDHIHMLVRVIPNMSIETCALLLMNNAQYFMSKYYSYELMRAKADYLWQPSAYVGTVGEYSTGLLQKWLRSEE